MCGRGGGGGEERMCAGHDHLSLQQRSVLIGLLQLTVRGF